MKSKSGISKRRRYRAIALELAEYFAERGHIVHFSQSVSTPSCYIKLDYGSSYTIRISDHQEIKGLDYRFNLMMDMTVQEFNEYKAGLPEPKYPRFFFRQDEIELLKHAVHLSKQKRMEELGPDGYARHVKYSKDKFDYQRIARRHTFASKSERIYPSPSRK